MLSKQNLINIIHIVYYLDAYISSLDLPARQCRAWWRRRQSDSRWQTCSTCISECRICTLHSIMYAWSDSLFVTFVTAINFRFDLHAFGSHLPRSLWSRYGIHATHTRTHTSMAREYLWPPLHKVPLSTLIYMCTCIHYTYNIYVYIYIAIHLYIDMYTGCI